jgi:predicted ATP-dependent endonuclease of OLD family
MALTKFTIKNFKCFQSEQSLILAKPDESLDGSGMTYIVGANNSGKTTLIEGLAMKDQSKISSSARIAGSEPGFSLSDDSGLKRCCFLIRPTSHTLKEAPKLQPQEQFEIISSRRYWEPNANNKFAQVEQCLPSSFEFQNRKNSIDVASALKTIEADEKKYEEFIDLIKEVVPEFTSFAVGFEEYDFIEYRSGSGAKHKINLSGDGVITVIRILLQLYISGKNPLIIDEPEQSLHPASQKKLLKVIARYAKNRQIIISTHSPYFIEWEYLLNGATLNRVVKTEDKHTSIFSIQDCSKYKKLIKAANWQQPFLLDAVAKEVFFIEDGILFLEGQEDVGLLRQEKPLEKINIFGYGVRGKDNFMLFLQLSKDLGYQKVCCVLDNGDSEKALKEALEKDFPNYKIIQWDKEDIRDKETQESKKKNGYYLKDGTKKDKPELGDFDQKINEINKYFE